MAIHIAVHDNEEGKKAVSLLTKRSQGQYRRWARHHSIQSRRETALNKYRKGKGKETMFHEGKHITTAPLRAHAILGVVGEAFGFGDSSLVNLTQVDTIARALGRVGFHANIRPGERGTWADVNATSVTNPATFIHMRIYPMSNAIIFQGWNATSQEYVDFEKAWNTILQNTPVNYNLVLNYDLLEGEPSARGNHIIHTLVTRTRPRWVSRDGSHVIRRRIEQREHALQNPEYGPGSTDLHDLSRYYDAKGHVNMGGDPIRGQPTPSVPSNQATTITPPIQFSPPQRGYERSASRPYGGISPETEFDYELSSMQRSGLPQRNELPAAGASAGTAGSTGYNYTSSVGRENEPQMSIGGRSAPSFGASPLSFGTSPFYSRSAADAAAAIVSPARSAAGILPPHVAAVGPSSALFATTPQGRRVLDTDRSHRHFMGQPWGVDHPAVVRLRQALHGHAEDRGRLGVFVKADNGTTLLSLHVGGRSPQTGFYAGTLTFHTANIHRLQEFFNMIPQLAFKTRKGNKSAPIIWTNDFRPLIKYVHLNAPNELRHLASALAGIPNNDKKTRVEGVPSLGSLVR